MAFAQGVAVQVVQGVVAQEVAVQVVQGVVVPGVVVPVAFDQDILDMVVRVDKVSDPGTSGIQDIQDTALGAQEALAALVVVSEELVALVVLVVVVVSGELVALVVLVSSIQEFL